MDRQHNIPDDLAECQRLLLAAFKQTVQLEQQAAASQQRVAELDRVLDATSDSYQELQQEHTSTIEELAWYKRWVHGRRRERIVEGEGQQHLFDLALPEEPKVPAPLQEPRQQIAGILAVGGVSSIFLACRTTGTNWTCQRQRRRVAVVDGRRTVLAKT